MQPPTRRMNPAEFYRPVAGLLEPARLRQKRVTVIGLGSGGCRVAAELGRLGIQLLLVERPGEPIEEHNIVRHLLGYRSLGKSKLGEMSRYIRNLNPAAGIETCSLDVVAKQTALGGLLERWKPDLIAVCTDNQPSKHAVNEVALGLGVPQTGGAVYDGGIGGEVYRIRCGGACYGCLAAQLRLDRQDSPRDPPADYTSPAQPELPVTCALNLDIEQIALLQCRMSLDLLLEPEPELTGLPPEVNLAVFANRVAPGTFSRPWHCEFFSIDRRRDCLACGQGSADLERESARILAELKDTSQAGAG